MSTPIVDVRLVLDRSRVWRVSIDGRRVPTVSGESPSDALHALAVVLTAVAWTAGEHEHDVLADPASRLYSEPERLPTASVQADPRTAPVPCLHPSERP